MLDGLNASLGTRDLAVARSFHADGVFLGSEPGELGRGREAITALFAAIFASPNSIRFEWRTIEAQCAGQIIWFFADGEAVITATTGLHRRAYTLTGVLDISGGEPQWRLFHGSEPWIDPSKPG